MVPQETMLQFARYRLAKLRKYAGFLRAPSLLRTRAMSPLAPPKPRARRLVEPLLARYLREAGRHPKLGRDEEQRLGRRVRDLADRRAAERLIHAQLRTVVRVARGYRDLHPSLLDLVQEGNVALVRAVRRFDPDRGVRLCAHVRPWVRRYIVRFILASTALEADDGARLPSPSELRALLDQRAPIADVEPRDEREERLEGAVGRDGVVREDLLVDDSPAIEAREVLARVSTSVPHLARGLSGRDLSVLRHRLLGGARRTLAEEGAFLGITAERVRQIERGLIEQVRALVLGPGVATATS
jgi:RNA polymerase sigma factor (sigma-70 family)